MNISFSLHPLPRDEASLAAALDVYRQCEDFLALGPVAKASMAMVLADLALSEQEGGTFYGIYDAQGGLAGVVDYVVSGFEGDPAAADLTLLMIAAPYRGQGLGEAVVRAVEADIRRDGRARVILSGVQVNNPGGVRFWQRMGYQIVSGPERQADTTITYGLRKALC